MFFKKKKRAILSPKGAIFIPPKKAILSLKKGAIYSETPATILCQKKTHPRFLLRRKAILSQKKSDSQSKKTHYSGKSDSQSEKLTQTKVILSQKNSLRQK